MIGGAQDAAPHARARREVRSLGVFRIGADVADVRKGERDDLTGITRIGQDFLITGHGRVEADLADGASGRTETLPGDDGAVIKHEARGQRHVGPGFGAFIVCPNGLGREVRSGVSQDLANSAAGPQFAPEPRGTAYSTSIAGSLIKFRRLRCLRREAHTPKPNQLQDFRRRDAREDQRGSEDGDESRR